LNRPPDTRDRLIEVARQLFWEKGFQATSVAEILAGAEANSGSLYHHFDTKQDLLVAVLERYRDGIGPMLLEPAWRGIVEECFPIEAMRDLHVFYDAVGDEPKFERNLAVMMESCGRFLDADGVDVVATSEYILHPHAEPTL